MGKRRNLGNVSEVPWAVGKSCEDKGATRITARPHAQRFVKNPTGQKWKLSHLWVKTASVCPCVYPPHTLKFFFFLAELEHSMVWVLVPGGGHRSSHHSHTVPEKLPRPISGLLLTGPEPVCIFAKQSHQGGWSYLAPAWPWGPDLCKSGNSPGVKQLRLKGHQQPFFSIPRSALLQQPGRT